MFCNLYLLAFLKNDLDDNLQQNYSIYLHLNLLHFLEPQTSYPGPRRSRVFKHAVERRQTEHYFQVRLHQQDITASSLLVEDRTDYGKHVRHCT